MLTMLFWCQLAMPHSSTAPNSSMPGLAASSVQQLLSYSPRLHQSSHAKYVTCMQTLAACHGLASGLLHHWETLLYAPTSAAPHSMVYALMGEYASHRTHFATFQVIAKPGPITRLLLLGTQVRNTVLPLLASCLNLPWRKYILAIA